MKIEISKDWCLRMAQHEGDGEIGAVRLAADPVFDGRPVPADVGDGNTNATLIHLDHSRPRQNHPENETDCETSLPER